MTDALKFTIAMPGLPALSVALSRLRTDIADWTRFWTEEFAPYFYRNVQQDFVLEGGASGESWAPLSAQYAAWKAMHYPGTGILVRGGALKASLAGPDAPDAVFRPTATSLEIGTSVGYAQYHQFGTGRMPQRPPMRVNDAFMRVIGKSLQKFVQARWQERRAEMLASAPSAPAA